MDYISKTIKNKINQLKKGEYENNNKMQIKLLDKLRMNSKIMNNELKQNNDYTHLLNNIANI